MANKIQPGKRPQSSMSPLIILDPEGDVRMLAGGTGGTRIITGLLNVRTSRMIRLSDRQFVPALYLNH